MSAGLPQGRRGWSAARAGVLLVSAVAAAGAVHLTSPDEAPGSAGPAAAADAPRLHVAAPGDLGTAQGGAAGGGSRPGTGQEGRSAQEENHSTRQAGHSAQEEGGGGGHQLPYARIFLVLISILLTGKLLGEAAERIGQPAVLGELLAGVILGGSVLAVIPEMGTTVGDVVHVFAEIGVAILLFEIGLETDLKEMFRVGTSATAVALVGIFLPFFAGFFYWFMADPQIGVHPPGVEFWMVAIFIGATLTATSVGITARVLSDLDKMHTSEARIIIGAAVIDDVLGIVILAVVAGMVGGQEPTALGVGQVFLFAVGYLVLAVWIGNKAAPYLFDLVDKMRVRGVLLVSALCFALLLAALAELSGSAMIIGAFAAGIVLSSTNQFDTVVQRIEPVADVFTPIFFVVVGAPVNVDLFIPGAEDFDIGVLVVGLILTAIAIVGKVVAGWATRRSELNRLAIGVGMIPRGEVGLIFAAIGLAGGVLSNAVYSAVLIMVILSTFVVPPFLKGIFERGGSHAPEGGGERELPDAVEGAAAHAAEAGRPGVTEGGGGDGEPADGGGSGPPAGGGSGPPAGGGSGPPAGGEARGG